MSSELSANRVPETLNDPAVFTSVDLEAGAVTWGHVAENVNLLAGLLGSQKGVVQPLELCPWEAGLVQKPPVVGVAVVVVDCDDAEARLRQDRVIASKANSGEGILGKPLGPFIGEESVQPLGREALRDGAGSKQVDRMGFVVSDHWVNRNSGESFLQEVMDLRGRRLNEFLGCGPQGVIDNVSGEVDVINFLK